MVEKYSKVLDQIVRTLSYRKYPREFKLVNGTKKSSLYRTKELLRNMLFLYLNEFHARVNSFKYNRVQYTKFMHAYSVPELAIDLHQLTFISVKSYVENQFE